MRADHHARPRQDVGRHGGRVVEHLARGRRGGGCRARRRPGPRHHRRLPRRRRHLERHRVVDGAVVERRAIAVPLQELERQQPRALAAFAPALHRRVERPPEGFRALQAQRVLPPARVAQHVGQQPRAGVVEFRDRRQVEARLRRVRRDRATQRLELAGARGGQLAGDAHVAARRRALTRRRPDPIVPGRRRALELDDVFQRELLERAAVPGPLDQVEQREPGERRGAGLGIPGDAFRQQRAGGLGVAAGEQQHRVLQHGAHARVAVRHLDHPPRRRRLDQAEAGDGDSAARRLAGAPAAFTLAPPLRMRSAAAVRALRPVAVPLGVRPGRAGLPGRQLGEQRHGIRGPFQVGVESTGAAGAARGGRCGESGSTPRQCSRLTH